MSTDTVVTPPSSEVCAGKDLCDIYPFMCRNPSELRGLCRRRQEKVLASRGRNPSELRGLCRTP